MCLLNEEFVIKCAVFQYTWSVQNRHSILPLVHPLMVWSQHVVVEYRNLTGPEVSFSSFQA